MIIGSGRCRGPRRRWLKVDTDPGMPGSRRSPNSTRQLDARGDGCRSAHGYPERRRFPPRLSSSRSVGRWSTATGCARRPDRAAASAADRARTRPRAAALAASLTVVRANQTRPPTINQAQRDQQRRHEHSDLHCCRTALVSLPRCLSSELTVMAGSPARVGPTPSRGSGRRYPILRARSRTPRRSRWSPARLMWTSLLADHQTEQCPGRPAGLRRLLPKLPRAASTAAVAARCATLRPWRWIPP